MKLPTQSVGINSKHSTQPYPRATRGQSLPCGNYPKVAGLGITPQTCNYICYPKLDGGFECSMSCTF